MYISTYIYSLNILNEVKSKRDRWKSWRIRRRGRKKITKYKICQIVPCPTREFIPNPTKRRRFSLRGVLFSFLIFFYIFVYCLRFCSFNKINFVLISDDAFCRDRVLRVIWYAYYYCIINRNCARKYRSHFSKSIWTKRICRKITVFFIIER